MPSPTAADQAQRKRLISPRNIVPGATIEDLRASDGAAGYSDKLKHGETGKGLNDYDAIFRILAGVGFAGWISVEDGMNGLGELRRSVEFLKGKRAAYYGDQAARRLGSARPD